MKNISSVLLKAAAPFFILMMIFSSCGNQLQPTDSDKAYVTFAASIQRTVFPTVTVDNCTSFTLTGVSSVSTEVTSLGSWASYAELQKSTVEVTPGTWNFTLTATASGLTYTQTLEGKEITAGSSTPLEFTLAFSSYTATSGTTGTLSYTITYPLNTAAKVITAGLYTMSSSTYTAVTGFAETELTPTASSSENTALYTAEKVPSGNYYVGYTIYGDTGKTVTLNSNKESVYIADGLTSTGSASLSSINSMYTVTYEPNSGTLASTTTNYSVYSQITLPTSADITRTGYTFGGWYTASDFTGTVVTEIAKGSTGDITLYAKWTENVSDFASLNTAVTNGGTYIITSNISITAALTVAKDTTLTAASAYTLTRSTFTDAMFTVSSGVTFTLGSDSTSSITLDGGSLSTATGALINSTGTLTTTNCIFENNTSSLGGAVIINSGTTTSTFTNCNFTGNTSTSDGGAVAVQKNTSATFTNCTFTSNTASSKGGGISVEEAGATVNTDNCVFTSNKATSYYGGAIFVYAGSLNINSIEVNSNTAATGNDIYLYAGTTTIKGNVTGASASSPAMELYFYSSNTDKPVLTPSGTITLKTGTAINVTISKITSGMTLLTQTDSSILSSAISCFTLADTAYKINTDGTITQ